MKEAFREAIKQGIQLSPQHQSVLDMSIKTISQYLTLLESIMLEWEKLSGVTRQRQGQMGTYEGKATSQQSIVQSSHITEDIFRKFSNFEQRELQGLLDYSKEAWLNGKKATYVMPDGSFDELDIDPITHMESEYGIFVSDAGKDVDKKQKIEGLAQAAVQNGLPLSAAIAIYESDSLSQIKDKIVQAEKTAEQLKQAQEQALQQQEQAKLQMQQQIAQQASLDKEKDRQVGGLENVYTYKVGENRTGGGYNQYNPDGTLQTTWKLGSPPTHRQHPTERSNRQHSALCRVWRLNCSQQNRPQEQNDSW